MPRRTERSGLDAEGPSGALYGLEDLPGRVDAAWWDRHKHLSASSDLRSELLFRPRDVAAAPGAEVGAGGGPGRGVGPPLAELVGQARLRAELGVALQAARIRGEPAPPLPSVLQPPSSL